MHGQPVGIGLGANVLKRMALNVLLVVLVLFLANALTHQLPNAIADFIYRTPVCLGKL